MVKYNITNSDDPMKQIIDCLELIKNLDEETKNPVAVLDLSDLEWISPFAALLISNKISQLRRKLLIEPPANQQVKSYLKTIGFPLGRSAVGKTYCPIQHFTKNVQQVANDVFYVVDKNFPEALKGNAIKYIIGEVCDNVEQHSEFTYGSVMAQFFPKKNFVDIGILDNGISIPALFEKYKIKFNQDCHAIDMALKGVSTKHESGRGKGLFSTTQIVEKGLKGELYIISRNGAVEISPNNRKFYKLQAHTLNGTLAYIRFKAPDEAPNIFKYVE